MDSRFHSSELKDVFMPVDIFSDFCMNPSEALQSSELDIVFTPTVTLSDSDFTSVSIIFGVVIAGFIVCGIISERRLLHGSSVCLQLSNEDECRATTSEINLFRISALQRALQPAAHCIIVGGVDARRGTTAELVFLRSFKPFVSAEISFSRLIIFSRLSDGTLHRKKKKKFRQHHSQCILIETNSW